MKKVLTSLILLPLFFTSGCDGGSPTAGPERSPRDEQVILNCYTVQAAAEAYAADNDGYYPMGIGWRNRAGKRLVEYLPGGTALENPYTNLLREPDPPTAIYPGQTGYRAYCGPSGALGYFITGFGADAEIISLSNLPRDVFYFEDQTIANCYIVQTAVHAFAAENNGEYPSDTIHTTPSGKTVIDFLPGGQLLVNPYTLLRTEPVDGAAATPGQTGYHDAISDNTAFSYLISGFGRCSSVLDLMPESPEEQGVKSSCYFLRQAVEEFAAQNDGVYPDDVDADMTHAGTVIDFLGGQYLWNRYTGERTEPRNRFAETRGEIGYLPHSQVGVNVGYTINGWGLNGEIIRFEKTDP